MAQVLCITHAGIRCGIPAKHVTAAQASRPSSDCIELWGDTVLQTAASKHDQPRAIQVTTALGPRWLLGTGARMISITAEQLLAVPPLLSDLLGRPYIVSLVWVDEQPIWLIDPRRCVPAGPDARENEPRQDAMASPIP